jgi:hypothetical protein
MDAGPAEHRGGPDTGRDNDNVKTRLQGAGDDTKEPVPPEPKPAPTSK